jgi:hypothetical protein
MKNIGVLVYTHNRTDDARINMEIIRNIWKKSKYFQNVKIVHCFNGKRKWYPEKYLEDELIIQKNSWHFQGAADLIDAGISKFYKKYRNIDYLIVFAADTWLIDPNYLENLLTKFWKKKSVLATCRWGLPRRNDFSDVGMALDFFIIDLAWAKKYKMFPIGYKDFFDKYSDLILYQKGGNVALEKLLLARYIKAVSREEKSGGVARKNALDKIFIIKDREPVHSFINKEGFWIRKMYWPKMGLLTHHDPLSKKKILKQKKIGTGTNIKKLISSKDMSYFNGGVTKMKHNCN